MTQIVSISNGTFIGAGLPMQYDFFIAARGFDDTATAVLLFDGVEVSGLTAVIDRPVVDGKLGQLRATLQTAALAPGRYSVAVRDASGDSPGVQIFLAHA